MFVAFSCKQRCTCPSCHQKRTLLTSLHVAQEVCAPLAHRQVVLTIDRSLLGKLSHCAWTCILAEVRRLLGRDDAVPVVDGEPGAYRLATPPPIRFSTTSSTGAAWMR